MMDAESSGRSRPELCSRQLLHSVHGQAGIRDSPIHSAGEAVNHVVRLSVRRLRRQGDQQDQKREEQQTRAAPAGDALRQKKARMESVSPRAVLFL
jgi:hypothetical protein